jgi:hypothetical protein
MSYKIDGLLRALLVIEILLFHFVSFFVEVFVTDFVAVVFEYFVKLKGFSNSATWPQEKTSRKNHNKKNVILSTTDTWSIRLCAEHDHKKKPQTSQTFFLDNTHPLIFEVSAQDFV